MKSQKLIGAAVAVAVGITAVLTGTSAASASEATPPPQVAQVQTVEDDAPAITPELIAQAQAELEAAGVTYTLNDGMRLYDIGDGNIFALPELDALETTPEPGVITPFLSTGGLSNNLGVYVDFSKQDQIALRNGTTVLLTAGICAFGVAACVIAGVITAVAGSYVNNNGYCPSNRPTLRTEWSWDGAMTGAHCY